MHKRPQDESAESGFMLVAVVVMAALVLVALAVAAPMIARDIRRDKEVESEHRANEYVRAIQLFYRKNKSYPPSIKALENTNNIRYLRHQYVDPLTGKSDWKMIHQGEQQTKIHVFFGKELGEAVAGMGAGTPNLGSAGSLAGAGGFGATTVNSNNALNAGFGGSTINGTTGTSTTTGPATTNGASSTTGTTGTNGSTGSSASNSSGTGMFGDSTGGIIVGVTTTRSGTSILNPNQQTTYDTWEFWYDPRIELLRQSVNITGGGISSQSASSFGKDAVSGQSNSGTSGTNGTSTTPSPTTKSPTFP